MSKSRIRQLKNENARIRNEIASNNYRIQTEAEEMVLSQVEEERHDIKGILKSEFENSPFNENQLIICDITQLDYLLASYNRDINYEPIFIFCETRKSSVSGDHFITCCITKYLNKITLLYKDYGTLGAHMHDGIKSAIMKKFGQDIDIKINQTKEIQDRGATSRLSVEALKNMANNLKSSNRDEFIKNFADNTKTKLFENIKGYASAAVQKTLDVFTSNLNLLSRDNEFKKEIKALIDSMPLDDALEDCLNLLSGLNSNEDQFNFNDSVKINETISKVVDLNRLEEINKKLSLTEDKNLQYGLDIQKKFPAQMEKFEELFTVCGSKMTVINDSYIRNISDKLELDYDKLKKFFAVRKHNITHEKQNMSLKSEHIHDVILRLSDLRSSTTRDKNPDSDSKTLDQLLEEIATIKGSEYIEALHDRYKQVLSFSEFWKDKDGYAIHKWAEGVKGKLTQDQIYEAIAIMDRANVLIEGHYYLRDTQILSVLIFLEDYGSGKLCQINTGEGKTTIVSLLAVIKALQGEVVDVVSSNPILAEEGVNSRKDFYSLFGLSVKTNNIDENYQCGPRECYKADIVYGSIINFQCDYLRDSFLGYQTRASRPFGAIILDEVDSMVIDNASHIAKLSSPFPGMGSLRYIYIKVWDAFKQAEKIALEKFRDAEEQQAKESKELQLTDIETQEKFEQFLKQLYSNNSLITAIKNTINKECIANIDIIPSHIKEYVNNTLDKWIDNAIHAQYYYNEDEQYVVREKDGEKVIQPVDYSNTGVTLKNTVWQYGLHQFLQLKHNLALTPESLTSCFISNPGYIKKYGNNIFGLTGTLGSKYEQDLLSFIYKVTHAIIPTYKEKKFIEKPGLVIKDEDFSTKVIHSIIQELEANRAVLVICETIKELRIIEAELLALKKEYEFTDVKIKTYIDENNEYVTEEEVDSRQVIIATNIAGRGTDFKTSSTLEEYGGLHVCITFLPCNQRVEDQAFGRTSRQGNNGSGQIIVKRSDIRNLIDSDLNAAQDYSFDSIKKSRDLKEKNRISDIENIKNKIEFQDALFTCFSNMYSSLRQQNESKKGYKCVLDDLSEYWAFWLERIDFDNCGADMESVERKFAEFKSQVAETIEQGIIKFNPYYSIKQAECFLNDMEDDVEKAEACLHHAIKISNNPEILYSAYIKLFEVAIKKGHQFYHKAKDAIGGLIYMKVENNYEYKTEAKDYLNKAKDAIQKELGYFMESTYQDSLANVLITQPENSTVTNNMKNHNYWYTDSDMDTLGAHIIPNINIDTQFKNRLTKDVIEEFCKNHQLQDNIPVFICYNINGECMQDSGVHWVAICVIKQQNQIKLLYKDSKGDFNNNAQTVQSIFTKYYQSLDFIINTRVDQRDDSSCGIMVIQNLKIMSNYIINYGIDKLVKDFPQIPFCKQGDVLGLRNEFGDILIANNTQNAKSENVFIKHLKSHQQALYATYAHLESIIKQVDDSADKGIDISTRIVNYFGKCDVPTEQQKAKDTLGKSELNELSAIGSNVFYAVREVPNVCDNVKKAARIQIGAGIGFLTVGLCVSPSLPAMGSLAGICIGEGITDVAMALISQDSSFDRKAYTKSKIISYSIGLATAGISAALQCPKILKAAQNACKWISDTLRKCPHLKFVCEKVAMQFDSLSNWFEKLECLAEFNNMEKKIERLEHLNKLNETRDIKKLTFLGESVKEIQVLQQELKMTGKLTEVSHIQKFMSVCNGIIVNAGKNAAQIIIMNKVIEPKVKSLLSDLKPILKQKISESVDKYIDRGKLQSTDQDINTIIQDIRQDNEFQTLVFLFKNGITFIKQNVNNWKLRLGAMATDLLFSWEDVYFHAQKLCETINNNLVTGTVLKSDTEISTMISRLKDQLCEEVFNKSVSTSIKTIQDVGTGFSIYKEYKRTKALEIQIDKVINDTTNEGECGSLELWAFSQKDNKIIKIYNKEGELINTIGSGNNGSTIELTRYDRNDGSGHWVPKGESEAWVFDQEMGGGGKNNCLFDAIAAQVGGDPNILRKSCVQHIKDNKNYYINPNIYEMSEFHNALMKGGHAKFDNLKSRSGICFTDASRFESAKLIRDQAENLDAEYKSGKITADQYNQRINALKAEAIFLVEGYVPDSTTGISYKIKDQDGNIIRYKAYPDHNKPPVITLPGGVALQQVKNKAVVPHEDNINQIKGIIPNLAKASNQEVIQYCQENGIETRLVPQVASLAMKTEEQKIIKGIGDVYNELPSKIQISILCLVYKRGNIDTDKNPSQDNIKSDEYDLKTFDIKSRVENYINDPSEENYDRLVYQIYSAHLQSGASRGAIQGIIAGNNTHYDSITKKNNYSNADNPSGKGLWKSYTESYWYEYTKVGVHQLLELRLKSIVYDQKSVKLLIQDDIVWDGTNNIVHALSQNVITALDEYETVIMPLNLYGKHWVGIIFEKTDEAKIKMVYMDSENVSIPSMLKKEFVQMIKDLNFVEQKVPQQKYNNCGPEMIENFISYLTYSRVLDQSDVVSYHSELLEQKILGCI